MQQQQQNPLINVTIEATDKSDYAIFNKIIQCFFKNRHYHVKNTILSGQK